MNTRIAGSETLIFSDLINFQYYIEVVPTVVDSYLGSKVSYQYSVKVWKKKNAFYFIILFLLLLRGQVCGPLFKFRSF